MTTPDFPAANLLNRETSPYLLQHKDNPVHWRAWGEAAFAEARARDVPILLSVGYAACHWCHVMAHESFEDEATAALMNELFVNVKVDREERPDVDTIYMTALHMMGEQGGWPLTMFMTPDGKPFWGGTYFPPESRYGRPGFPDVLRGISEAWRSKREEVSENVRVLVEALGGRQSASAGGTVEIALLDRIAEHLAGAFDPVHGGLKGAPKFPQCSIGELLWRAWLRSGRKTGNAQLRHVVTTTLDRMSQGGIYDHLGGGYARYSTDAVWLAPHFEKMLYDNAQIIDSLTLVWQDTQNPLYATRVAETIGWLEREMIAVHGAFAATLDADSEGEEGKFYVWSEAEIDALLGGEAAFFKEQYDVRESGNWEGHTILNRSRKMLLGDTAHEERLARARAVLFEARARRIPPGRDDKILADWNGLMIAAVARAGFVFDRPEWTTLAAKAFAAVTTHLRAPAGAPDAGRLRHSYRQGQAQHLALLDDHAAMARAAVTLYEVTGAATYRKQAEALVAEADRWYWDDKDGGYFFTAADARDLIIRTKTAHDNATPAGNGLMAQVLTRLYYLTGETHYRDRAAATIGAFSGELGKNFFPLATLLNAAEWLENAVQVVISGPPGDGRDALRRAVAGAASLPNLVLQLVGPEAALPASHPAHGKGMIDGRATAYICVGPVCSPPVTDPTALARQLRGE
jgi:uncharacterized protein YyaL (SSP411 family)